MIGRTRNVNVKDMPPVEVVRTEHGDYLYDGTHRTEFATRQREKIPAKVYAIKTVGNKGSFDPKKASIILGAGGIAAGLASVKAEAENSKDKKNVLALPDIKAKAQELQNSFRKAGYAR